MLDEHPPLGRHGHGAVHPAEEQHIVGKQHAALLQEPLAVGKIAAVLHFWAVEEDEVVFPVKQRQDLPRIPFVEHGAFLHAEAAEVLPRPLRPLRIELDGGEMSLRRRQEHCAGSEPFRCAYLEDAGRPPLLHGGKEIGKRFVGASGVAPLLRLLAQGVKL